MRAVGVVLQSLLQAGVAGQRQAERVVHAERQAVAEPAVERRLDRVIRVVVGRRLLR